MTIIDELLHQVARAASSARPVDVRIGGHWTLVLLEGEGGLRAGISSTLHGDDDHHDGGGPPVRDAGHLLQKTAAELAELARSRSLLEASVGIATLNALLDVDVHRCVEVNATDVILERGEGQRVAVVGHFPFLARVADVAAEIWVLELDPREGDLPAHLAPEILPRADVVALTGTSVLNHTFDDLITHCRPGAFVIMLGGTTPLSSRLFDHGVDAAAGTVITDPQAALLGVSQGATFKQIGGKRLLTLFDE